jgi:hypothetical protein
MEVQILKKASAKVKKIKILNVNLSKMSTKNQEKQKK